MARNNQSDSFNQNNRYSQSQSDDRIMRRGDDRTRQGSDWGLNHQNTPERNSYRTDDYPTDTSHYRAGAGEHRSDRDMAYGHYGSRDGQSQGQRNYTNESAPYTFNPERSQQSYGQNQHQGQSYAQQGQHQGQNQGQSYGWSNDYRSTQDYSGGSQDRMGSQNMDRSSSDSMRGGSIGSTGYGSGNYGSVTYGAGNYGAGNYGSGSSSFGPNAYGSNSHGSNSYGSSSSPSSMNRSAEGLHYGKGPKNYRRSDDRIKEDVSEALERNAHIDASELEIDVKDAVVTLRGHVEDRQTKRLAEDLVSAVYSVKDVRNELTVDQSIFTQARNMIFGETAESQSASSTNSNRSTATKSKH